MIALDSSQLERFERNILVSEIGEAGQSKLLDSRVLVIGTGGLGSPVLTYLAAAGVGTLGIADGDRVDLSNLQRQFLHSAEDLGRLKVESAGEKLKRLYPELQLNLYPYRADESNIDTLIRDYDFVIEATDNFTAKFLINDACVRNGIPFSHGGVLKMHGQTLTWKPGHACYRCLFSGPPPADAAPGSAQVGILGAAAGILGSIQASEAVKVLLGIGEPLLDRMLVFEALTMKFRSVSLRQRSDCPACSP